MRIAICDDEKEIRDLLSVKIKKLYPEANLCFYADGEELLSSGEEPDILFLDIQMPGIGGMEAARRLRAYSERTILIFVTALEDYVFQAFDVGAFHYLVKPFTDEKFAEVTSRAVEQYRKQNSIFEENPSERKENYLLIKSGSIHIKVSCGDIVYAEVFNRKLVLHTTEEEIECYGRMADLEKRLGQDFFRCHRAYLIHFKYVLKYDASTVFLEKGTALIAKKKYTEFVKQYLRYNQRKADGN
ncbi:MAG: LytTR family DNA-binding domain-containing protein [Clostridium sp.]|nr:LytTR family DNA-binding domain-containing protein [Clostridium sp.]